MLSTQKSSNLTNPFMNVSQIRKSLLLLSILYHPSSNSITKMAYILVMLDYPNFVAYLACIEFLLLPNLPDKDTRELVMVTHSAMMAPVH